MAAALSDLPASHPLSVAADHTMTTTTITATTAAEAADPIVSADPRCFECPTLETGGHIRESLGTPIDLPEHLSQLLSDKWASDPEVEEALSSHLAMLTGGRYQHFGRDNTYNSDNNLSANFAFSVWAPADCSDWIWCHDVFVVIETHLGGDVRGNYGAGAVYRVDNIGETGFFDWVVGWYASPINPSSPTFASDVEHPALRAANDRLAIGYSNWPAGEVDRLLIGCGCDRYGHATPAPTWSERLGCYVARLDGVPFAVRLEPVAPFYGI